MKNFEMLFDVIPPHPGLNIALIEDSKDMAMNLLLKYCRQIKATLHVKALKDRESLNSNDLRVKNFSFNESKYNNFSILYDFLFLCVDISDRDDIEMIFKKIYRVLKNAGNLFICIKRGEADRYLQILEGINYVALNSIELNRDTEVIVAKKMHGWKIV